MNARKTLRVISLVMFLVAIMFLLCAMSGSPGMVLPKICIGGVRITTVENARFFYKGYVVVMVILFVASFFVRGKPRT